MAYEAWAAKYRPLLKVVDIWVKSPPLVMKYNSAGLPEERRRKRFSVDECIRTKSSPARALEWGYIIPNTAGSRN